MLLQKGSREDAIHALINAWLKDKRKSCVYCGRNSHFEDCSDCGGVNPPLGTNKDILQGFSQELRQIRETRKNKYASTGDKSIRYAVSMPAGLYLFLRTSFKHLYKEELFTKEHDINWFMRKFGKYFSVPQER